MDVIKTSKELTISDERTITIPEDYIKYIHGVRSFDKYLDYSVSLYIWKRRNRYRRIGKDKNGESRITYFELPKCFEFELDNRIDNSKKFHTNILDTFFRLKQFCYGKAELTDMTIHAIAIVHPKDRHHYSKKIGRELVKFRIENAFVTSSKFVFIEKIGCEKNG